MGVQSGMNEQRGTQEQQSFGSWVKWLFQTFFFRILGINLVFLISCVPIITIPAALCGLQSVFQQYYRKQYATVALSAFFSEFFSSFVKRTLTIWGIVLIPIAVVIAAGRFLPYALWFSFACIMLVAVILVLSWLVPQLVLLNLDIRQALKNALLLTGIESITNLGLVAVHAVSMTVLVFGLPASAMLLVILPVLNAILITGLTMPVLRKYLVIPEENRER